MTVTRNIPQEWQQQVLDAIAASYQRKTGKAPDAILKELYTKLVSRMGPYTNAGKKFVRDPNQGGEIKDENGNVIVVIPESNAQTPVEFNMEFLVEHQLQVAEGMYRLVQWAMKYADDNPPTHRKGYGDSFVQDIPAPPDLIFAMDGTPTGGEWPDGQGKGFPDPDEPPPDLSGTGGYDWAPSNEIDRAKAMLATVAAETGFGYRSDPYVFVHEVARRLGGRWGLNGKRGDPNNPSRDVLAWYMATGVPQTFDVLQDAGGKNGVTWQNLPYTGNNAVWIAP